MTGLRRLLALVGAPAALLPCAAVALLAVIWLSRTPLPGPEQTLGVVLGPMPWRHTLALLGLGRAPEYTALVDAALALLVLMSVAVAWRTLRLARARTTQPPPPPSSDQVARAGAALELASFPEVRAQLPALLARRGYRVRQHESKRCVVLHAERVPALGYAPALGCLCVALAAAAYLGNAHLGTTQGLLLAEDQPSTQLPFALRVRDVTLPPTAAARTVLVQGQLCAGVDGQAERCAQVAGGQGFRHQGYTLWPAGYRALPSEHRHLVEVGPRGGALAEHRLRLGVEQLLADGARLQALHHSADLSGLGPALRVRWAAPGALPQDLLLFRDLPDLDGRMRGGPFELRYLQLERRLAMVLAVSRAPFTLPLLVVLSLLTLALVASMLAPLTSCQLTLVKAKGGAARLSLRAPGRARALAGWLRQELTRPARS